VVTPELLARVSAAEGDANVEYLRERIPAAFERSFDGIARVARLVGAIRAFAHPPTADRSPVDVNEPIHTTLVVAANEYGCVADVETDLGELPDVVCKAGDLNQAPLNLAVNAARAIADATDGAGERGTIRIGTRHDGEQVTLSISVTGCGIDPRDRRSHVRPLLHHQGGRPRDRPGLAITRTLVERHHGVIAFESGPGHGATFRIGRPTGAPADGNAAARSELPSLRRGKGADPCGRRSVRMLSRRVAARRRR
jgi:two-component system, NtrC family, sensor kinase